jgi:hypothetical protein
LQAQRAGSESATTTHGKKGDDGKDRRALPQILLDDDAAPPGEHAVQRAELLPAALELAPVIRLDEARGGILREKRGAARALRC